MLMVAVQIVEAAVGRLVDVVRLPVVDQILPVIELVKANITPVVALLGEELHALPPGIGDVPIKVVAILPVLSILGVHTNSSTGAS